MAPEKFVITYAAHTSACTFLLDGEGICRRIVMNPSNKRRDSAKTASQCVGAQYVASLDGSVAGLLVELPRVGSAMLFARVDERGRVSLVRTGPIQRFETMRVEEDPFDDVSVKTSAPEIVAPRIRKIAKPAAPQPDPDYFDVSDQTIRLPAATGAELPPEAPPTIRRPYPATLREARVELQDESDPYAARPPRSGGGRRSDPHVKAARTARPSSSRWPTDARSAHRRRER